MFSELRLKEKRIKTGLSQTFIAKELGISHVAYNHWESGKNVPNQKHLIALAKILEVPVTYFESEHNIVNIHLQLSPDNQVKAEEHVEDLLLSQQSSNITPLFSIQVLSDVQISAGLGERIFDEFKTETIYSDEEQYGYDLAAWIEGNSMEPVIRAAKSHLFAPTVSTMMGLSMHYHGMTQSISKSSTERKMGSEWFL